MVSHGGPEGGRRAALHPAGGPDRYKRGGQRGGITETQDDQMRGSDEALLALLLRSCARTIEPRGTWLTYPSDRWCLMVQRLA